MLEAIRQLKRPRALGHTHLCVEHLTGWLWGAYLYKYTTIQNLSHWDKMVILVKHMWGHRTLPTDLSLDILVFIQK